jgi:hypothetical protein
MNLRLAWAIIALAAVGMVLWLVLLKAYNPAGLFFYTIALYVVAFILFLNLRRVSKRKQAGSVVPST